MMSCQRYETPDHHGALLETRSVSWPQYSSVGSNDGSPTNLADAEEIFKGSSRKKQPIEIENLEMYSHVVSRILLQTSTGQNPKSKLVFAYHGH